MENRRRIAREIIEDLRQLGDALEAGGDIGAVFNCYRLELDLRPMAYSPANVKETRKLLRASQVIFAQFLGVSVQAIRHWEQGRQKPPPMACRFMDEIRRQPKHFLKRLSGALVSKRAQKSRA